VVELPWRIHVVRAAHDEREQREAIHSVPRTPSDGMSGSDSNALFCV
jgi:hypothetical protein